MKNGIILLLLILLGCGPSDRGLVEPALLFRTWQKTGGTLNEKPTENRGIPGVVEFMRNGELRYGMNKEEGGCCAPATFLIDSDRIRFFATTPLPDICARVNCARSELTTGVSWQIERLTDRELVIITNNQSISFEAVP